MLDWGLLRKSEAITNAEFGIVGDVDLLGSSRGTDKNQGAGKQHQTLHAAPYLKPMRLRAVEIAAQEPLAQAAPQHP